MTKKIYLEDIALSCSLGFESEKVLSNLRLGKAPGQMPWDKPVYSGREACVSRIVHALPCAEQGQYANNRNNQLAHFLCEQMAQGIRSLKARVRPERIGVVIGSSTSGIEVTERLTAQKNELGELPQNYDYQHQDMGDVSRVVAKLIGAKGPAYTVSTACTSSTRALISASKLIKSGLCDAVVCGGVDTLCHLTVNGFDSLEQVSAAPCRPFDANRRGINVGEGGALMIVTAEKSDIELSGFGESADAYHLSSPLPCGSGAYSAMEMALNQASLTPENIDYINAHGTSTEQNDAMESLAIYNLFSSYTPVSSTKALTGHCLGAAGAVEAAICALLLRNPNEPLPKQWPNDHEKDPTLADICLVGDLLANNLLANADSADSAPVTHRQHVMSNSFAFGGNNASVILSSVSES